MVKAYLRMNLDSNLVVVVNTFWTKDEEDLFAFHKYATSRILTQLWFTHMATTTSF